MRRTPTILALALAALLGRTVAAEAQTAPVRTTPEPAAVTPSGTSRAPAADTTAQLERIKTAISVAQTVRLDEDQLRFYVQVIVKPPSFAEYVKGQDLMTAPTKGGNPMSHQEFIRMMTPQGLFSR